jgi:hypothetical protein
LHSVPASGRTITWSISRWPITATSTKKPDLFEVHGYQPIPVILGWVFLLLNRLYENANFATHS